MSSKWRSLQHRHRYTYTSVVFPKSFVEALNSAPLETAASDFFSQLKRLISLTSTYSQVSAVKNLALAFAQLLAAPEISVDIASPATQLYLEIIFLENSLPLHRTLISALTKCGKFFSLISSCFSSLCKNYGELGSEGKKRFLVSRAALSLIGYPKLGFLDEVVEKCAGIVALDVIAGLAGVLSDIDCGSRPSPVVMEQCQEAMSCMYYLLQRYPSKFMGLEEASSVFQGAITTILRVLSSSAFSRDCLVASGVSFFAAIQVFMTPMELSSFISRGVFGFLADDGGLGDLGRRKVLPKGDLYVEIRYFSILNRLCFLRGILSAIPRKVLNMRLVHSTNGSFFTILYDGILPEVCKYCESPIDSHFNFHALTVIQICLQQIKTSILADLTDLSGDYEPFSKDIVSRILRIIWNNLEDPLSQTVKQVHLVFDLLLDIESSLAAAEGNGRSKLFLCKIASDLLSLGPHCKGRYIPLASLTKRLGAKTLLNLNNNLLFETVFSYIDDDVCCAATSFLKCFLQNLRDECWSDNGIKKGYDAFRALCLLPLMQGLVSGHSKLRTNLNTYALPVVLDIDTDSIFSMLAYISIGPSAGESKFKANVTIDMCIAALVSLLKVSRMLSLVEGDIDLDYDHFSQQKDDERLAIIVIRCLTLRVPIKWFVLALTHADESLRIDAAESLFLNPRTSSLPSCLELRLMKEVVPLNMRCSSTAFQMKWTSLFRKFFSRVRTALERQAKQGLWLPYLHRGVKDGCLGDDAGDIICRAEDLFQFMKWLSGFLFSSCYPSAPYERKTMAMELILIMIDVWPTNVPIGSCDICPYNEGIISPGSTISLVGSIVDSWDRLRENSYRILLSFPTPLPGISSSSSVDSMIRWAKKLVNSPRVRESDAGAFTFRLIFKKYVLDLGYLIWFSSDIDCLKCQTKPVVGDSQVSTCRNAVVQYVSSLVEWLRVVVEKGEKDLSEACKNSFVHGVLLTLRYTFEELDWNSEVVQSSSSEMRCLLEQLLQLIVRITSLALWVVSADAWYMPYDEDDMVDDAPFLSDVLVGEDQFESVSEMEDRNLKSGDNGRPAEHVVMVGCWLAMKEVSLLLGTIIRKIPLLSCTHSNPSEDDCSMRGHGETEQRAVPSEMLDVVQLETMGNHFLQILLKMKHNGAIDKTRAGFTALCNRLLCSNDSRLCKMTEMWMNLLMERTIAKGQTVDDLLRRSAGIPAAFIALFLAEPEGTPKKLLPRALEWLINIAKMSLLNTHGDVNQKAETANESSANGSASKIRDEGVVPTVHALNVLRAAFNDTNLASDTSGFCSEAMIVSIRLFSSPYWEVRNAACLAYTALVRRMVGFFNVQKRESGRRSLTGLEFFHRYPALHPFIFNELEIATELLGDRFSSHMKSSIANAIHPSLCPILILLSRLKPSLMSYGTDDALDPFVLMPFIQRCTTQRNLRVRVLASRALTGLVSNEKLQEVISDLSLRLPEGKHQMTLSSYSNLTFNSIHGLMLQLASLLDNNFRHLTDLARKDQVTSELIRVLSKCSWLGDTKLCPCPVLNSSYMQVLGLMLDVARTGAIRHTATVQTLLLELTVPCLDADKFSELALYDPTRIELCQQAARSYFSCIFKGNSEDTDEDILLNTLSFSASNLPEKPEFEMSHSELHGRIISCISDDTYEVRVATLKMLLRLVKSRKSGEGKGAFYMWARTSLHSVLRNRLFVEENPKCIYYIIKIIFLWDCQLGEPANMQWGDPVNVEKDSDSLFCFWDRLVQLNSTMLQSKIHGSVLCCMAICVKQFIKLLRSSIFVDRFEREEVGGDLSKPDQVKRWVMVITSIDLFVTLVNGHSAPSQPVNMRRAAAEALMASSLLDDATYVAPFLSSSHIPAESGVCNATDICSKVDNVEIIDFYACRILDLWFTCIQLLEDEDVGLRQVLAKNLQLIIAKGRSTRNFCEDAVSLQVDKLIRLSFDFLSSVLGNWLHYVSCLLRWVLDACNSLKSRGDLVRQIFDKEIDNHHEEKLLICQICCSNVEKLSVSNSRVAHDCANGLIYSDFEAYLQDWRLRYLRQLTLFAGSYPNTEERTEWIGGIGNHKDAFTSVYANLLGLLALTQYTLSEPLRDAHKLYLMEFLDLGDSIRPFTSNPLISNLWFMVTQSHEKMFGVLQSQPCLQESAVWDGFDPYFLLR